MLEVAGEVQYRRTPPVKMGSIHYYGYSDPKHIAQIDRGQAANASPRPQRYKGHRRTASVYQNSSENGPQPL